MAHYRNTDALAPFRADEQAQTRIPLRNPR